MPRPTVDTDTREAIMRTAGRMMQMRGYTSFSFAHIATELKMKAAAIHYHFRTKEDLGLALIERYRQRYRIWMDDAAALPVETRLAGYFAMFERFAPDGRVCFEGVLEVEYHTLPEAMQKALAKMVHESQAWLAGVLEEGRKEGTLAFTGSAHVKARLLCSTMQGALQTARLEGPRMFTAILAQVRSELIV